MGKISGTVVEIYISPVAGGKMNKVESVMAIAGQGLEGDRYAKGEGSFNKGCQGRRQVTLINGFFVADSGFEFADTRRNIVTSGIELMRLIGQEFQIGAAVFRGVKYCDPCSRPSKISEKKGFKTTFSDRGGLVAEIIQSGIIRAEDQIVGSLEDYD